MFFVVKQKTAYEMRISDWSSDVCSSDLTTVSGSRLVARNRSKLIAGLSVLGLMGTAACPAYAPDAGADTRASAGSDIVVTARKREENPNTVQIARAEERRVGTEVVSVELGGRRISKNKKKI